MCIRDRLTTAVADTGADGPAATVGMTTALSGTGGFGKTTLARMLVHDPAVRDLFPDGIVWTTIGENVTGPDLAERVTNLCAVLTGIRPPLTDPLLAGGRV